MNNKKQQKAKWRYSAIYKEPGRQVQADLGSLSAKVFTDMLPDDHTGTKARWIFYANRNNVFDCKRVYADIVDYHILRGDKQHPEFDLSIADWVNLRDTLSMLMWRFQIGTEIIFGERPLMVQQSFEEAQKVKKTYG